MQTALMVVAGILSLVIIVSVAMQSGDGNATAALGGANMAGKKAKGYEALLSKITTIASIAAAIVIVVLLIIQ